MRPRDDRSRCIARVYSLSSARRTRRRLYDFDDMIVLAVRLLRTDAPRRASAGSRRFEHVLVDEYQDIEPAQELLVRMLAAPHDDLFVVGDEDQTLYGWRRASVHRMIDLDAAYPALRRVALEHNYRCTPEVVAASAALIAHNRLRFAKAITPRPGRPPGGERAIRLAHYASRTLDDGRAAARAQARAPTRGRTSPCSGGRSTPCGRTRWPPPRPACAISGPDELFDAAGAQETLEAYFAVLSDPGHASEADVRVILRRPSRGLGQDAAARICTALTRRRVAAGGDRAPAGRRERPVARRARRGGLRRARRDRRRRRR